MKRLFLGLFVQRELFLTFSFRKQLIPTISAHSVAVLSILTFYLIYINCGFIIYF